MPILPTVIHLPALQETPAPPAASEKSAKKSHTPRYGVDVSTYIPSSSKVRRLFGGNWFGVGPAFTPIGISDRTVVVPDIDLLTQSKDGNLAILAFGGAEVSHALTKPTGYFLPYVGGGADVVFAHAETPEVLYSRFSVAGSAFVGTRLGKAAYVEFRYRLMPTIYGLNFGGTSITLGLRFF